MTLPSWLSDWMADGWRLAAALALALVLLGLVLSARPRSRPFRVRARALLTANEFEFHQRLLEALPDCRVLVQVSMGALIEPDIAGGSGDWLAIRARFAQKVVDFVIVDDAMQVLALIELDDTTHDPARDAERDAITRLAGYRTLRYQSRDKPAPEQIRADLMRGLAAAGRRSRGRATP